MRQRANRIPRNGCASDFRGWKAKASYQERNGPTSNRTCAASGLTGDRARCSSGAAMGRETTDFDRRTHMPLNLSVGDGDFTPYLKYNAKAGRFYVKPEGA